MIHFAARKNIYMGGFSVLHFVLRSLGSRGSSVSLYFTVRNSVWGSEVANQN